MSIVNHQILLKPPAPSIHLSAYDLTHFRENMTLSEETSSLPSGSHMHRSEASALRLESYTSLPFEDKMLFSP